MRRFDGCSWRMMVHRHGVAVMVRPVRAHDAALNGKDDCQHEAREHTPNRAVPAQPHRIKVAARTTCRRLFAANSRYCATNCRSAASSGSMRGWQSHTHRGGYGAGGSRRSRDDAERLRINDRDLPPAGDRRVDAAHLGYRDHAVQALESVEIRDHRTARTVVGIIGRAAPSAPHRARHTETRRAPRCHRRGEPPAGTLARSRAIPPTPAYSRWRPRNRLRGRSAP